MATTDRTNDPKALFIFPMAVSFLNACSRFKPAPQDGADLLERTL
jgi:hypothetical protein